MTENDKKKSFWGSLDPLFFFCVLLVTLLAKSGLYLYLGIVGTILLHVFLFVFAEISRAYIEKRVKNKFIVYTLCIFSIIFALLFFLLVVDLIFLN